MEAKLDSHVDKDPLLQWLESKIHERGLSLDVADRDSTAEVLRSAIGSVAEGVLSRAAAASETSIQKIDANPPPGYETVCDTTGATSSGESTRRAHPGEKRRYSQISKRASEGAESRNKTSRIDSNALRCAIAESIGAKFDVEFIGSTSCSHLAELATKGYQILDSSASELKSYLANPVEIAPLWISMMTGKYSCAPRNSTVCLGGGVSRMNVIVSLAVRQGYIEETVASFLTRSLTNARLGLSRKPHLITSLHRNTSEIHNTAFLSCRNVLGESWANQVDSMVV